MNSPISVLRPLHERQSTNPSGLVLQSRETGELVSQTQHDGAAITKHSPVGKSWAHFVAGAAGGTAAAIVTAPLDVLKTRLQSDFYQGQLAATRAVRGVAPLSSLSLPRSAALHIRETFQILFAIPRIEGWRALFKGLGTNLTGVIPARAINFYTYGNGKRLISQHFNNGKEGAWVHLCAAATAGIVTGTITSPIWVIKTRLQLDRSIAEKVGTMQIRRYKNALDCTIQTVKGEGIRGLYRGLSASYLGVSESTLQWMLYEQMKAALAKRQQRLQVSGHQRNKWDGVLDWGGKAGAAGVAKLFAAVLTYPHEVVRTRLRQSPLQNGHLKYTGIMQCLRLLWKEEGFVALYGGLVPHMLRVVPSAAIMFGVYESTLLYLGTDSGV